MMQPDSLTTADVADAAMEAVADGAVLLRKHAAALWITLNRPDKRNALNPQVIEGIGEGYRRAHADPSVRAIVLTGAGDKAFCAGGDLQPGQGFVFDHARPNVPYADLLRLAANATLPSIARINGTCMAGGMGLLAMADMAVAADHALFGLPEVKIGLFPMQVLSLLQHLVPPRLLREWCFSGEPFDAATARDSGLLNHVVPAAELDAKVAWLLARLTDKSPTAIRRGRYAMRAMAAMSFDEAIAYTEGQLALLSQTEDAQEGLAAFNDKRRPVWRGR
ncbi:enoyl-CoA hydratase/isomerase family protein [Thauera linaloolentis]|uniref:enoyl-CoA hydratase/isomerase family protein n=1 Tax=Thauera linaloolentis TaxID=76112 RepID=UPI0003083CDB|nr:enoyl-CoA hydratase/isomerase family protein [Thauera linaloolentis]MCM8565477.1 enoyl-CoA hydratase/isomerase family protein [Thauera linaloolentis]